MRLYRIEALRGRDEIIHERLSITKATPIARQLLADGWTVVMRFEYDTADEPEPLTPGRG